MILMFLSIATVYLAANSYLFWRTWQLMLCLPLWSRILVSIVFWTSAISLFLSIGLRNVPLPSCLSQTMFSVGSVWMVFLLYMVMLMLLFEASRLVFPMLRNPILYTLPITALIMVAGHINYRYPRAVHIDIRTEKPLHQDRIRIVSVSDIHLGHGTGICTLKKYAQTINAQNPDLILISGDLIDNSISPLLEQPFSEVLSTLKAPMGIYMVPGNHEYISGITECENFLGQTPIHLLRDSIVTLPCGLQLVGRDDKTNANRLPLVEFIGQTKSDKFVVVLDHQPYGLSLADSPAVDLFLCGHTHRGQVWPLSWITDCMYEQSHGYRKWSHTHIWVSSGLSLWGPPFRIGTNSDFAVIDVMKR